MKTEEQSLASTPSSRWLQRQRQPRHPVQTRPSYTRRLWEVDAVRGVAIVMMVIYHFMYDLHYFGVTDAIFTDPFWFYFQRTTATLFIGVVGISLALRRYRAGGKTHFVHLARRGGQIFLWGLLISLVTWFALGPTIYIRFGILHFIGAAIVLAYPFLGLRWLNLALGAGLIGIGVWVQAFTFEPPWSYFFWLGLEPANHMYVDFFPLIRWFGVVLIGIFLGNMLYSREGRTFSIHALSLPISMSPISLRDVENHSAVHALIQMGRRSLPIYLVHQPVLFALFTGFFLLVAWLS